MTHSIWRRVRVAAVACLLFGVTGCKDVLYSELSQVDANEMVAVLAASQVPATRERSKDGLYSILVETTNVPIAVALLRDQGLPRKSFQSLGEVFGADGLVGTPFEEQARFLHAMNQELSRAITEIAGIQSATVLVTVPPKGRFQTEPAPASASVVLHHRSDFESRRHVPIIKNLVAHSMPDLNYDDVEVALFPTNGPVLSALAGPAEAIPRANQTAQPQADKWASAWSRPKPSLFQRPFLLAGILGAIVAVIILLCPRPRRRERRDLIQ